MFTSHPRLVRAALATACAVLGACSTPSLHPLATDATVEVPGAAGTWTSVTGDGKTMIMRVAGPEGGVYRVGFEIPEQPDASPAPRTVKEYRMLVRVVALGEHRIADAAPDFEAMETCPTALLARPMHYFARVEAGEDRITIREFEPDWLDALLKKEDEAVAHAHVDGEVILTAPTKELVEFFTRHAGDEAAFRTGSIWTRAADRD